MWILGFDTNKDNKNIKLDDRHDLETYKIFMKEYLLQISKICNKDTSVILVVGDANNRKVCNYFDIMWDSIKIEIPLRLEETYEDSIIQKKKVTNSLGSKAGKATRIDKIYVFKLK
ncbi:MULTISPECIES: hypothetical protein [unclassified Spiroplasma]|uniref:hypothetical protein n=1 Tax=unclassified Spiroplasma TaxID=2637901 RepID=UPI0030D2F547